MAWCHLAPHQIAQLDRFNRLRAVFRFDRRTCPKTRQLQRLAEHKFVRFIKRLSQRGARLFRQYGVAWFAVIIFVLNRRDAGSTNTNQIYLL